MYYIIYILYVKCLCVYIKSAFDRQKEAFSLTQACHKSRYYIVGLDI